jgi:hypothetical protein
MKKDHEDKVHIPDSVFILDFLGAVAREVQ